MKSKIRMKTSEALGKVGLLVCFAWAGSLPQANEEKKKIVGKKLKNSISSGRALYHSNFEKDWLIEKNSIIVIENRVGSITIKEEGVALNNADFMGKIRVKNIKSGKIISGYAKNEKKVILKTKQY